VSHFVIAPPLIVEKEEIVRGIGMLDKWLHMADELCDADAMPETVSVTSDS
jgi:taurine--2-oxoglutarate transaminase